MHCTSCTNTIAAGQNMCCAKCGRTIHRECIGSQQLGDNSICLICQAAGDFNEQRLLPIVDKAVKTSSNPEMSTLLAWLFQRVCILTQEVDRLKSNQEQAPCDTAMDSTTAAKQTDKKALIIGDGMLKDCLKLMTLPKEQKHLPINMKSVHTSYKAVLDETIKTMEKTSDPLQVIIHAGQTECIKFEHKAAVEMLDKMLLTVKTSHPNHSIIITSVPVYNTECRDFNRELVTIAEKYKEQVRYLDITNIQSSTALAKALTYDRRVAGHVANVLMRHACKHIGVKSPLQNKQSPNKKDKKGNLGKAPGAQKILGASRYLRPQKPNNQNSSGRPPFLQKQGNKKEAPWVFPRVYARGPPPHAHAYTQQQPWIPQGFAPPPPWMNNPPLVSYNPFGPLATAHQQYVRPARRGKIQPANPNN